MPLAGSPGGFPSETLEQVQISEAFAANTKKSVVIFDPNSGGQIDAFRVGGFAHADVIVRPALVGDQARDLCNQFADSIIEV
jgi:DNA-binding GntR family transcriptional regulator